MRFAIAGLLTGMLLTGCHKATVSAKGSDGTQVTVNGDDNNGSVHIDGPGGKVDVEGNGNEGHVKIDGPGGHVDVNGDDKGGHVDVHSKDGDVHVNGKGDSAEVSVDGKDGSVHVGPNVKISEKELGLPFYPGAKYTQGVRSESKGSVALAVTMESSADFDTVVGYYRKALSGFIEKQEGSTVKFTKREGDTKREVGITHEDGKTGIALSYSTK